MKSLEIFDPALCCSTGVCGPSIDTNLLRVSTVVNVLKKKGMSVTRHNLSQEPQDFVNNKVISNYLVKNGAKSLPITLLDGEIVKTSSYPTNEEFAEWLGIPVEELSESTHKVSDNCCDGRPGCC
jgi:hypothetical protein